MNTTTCRLLALASSALVLASCGKKEAEPKPAPSEPAASAPATPPASAPATPPASAPASASTSAPLSYEESASVAMSGKVEALDYATRWITLRDPAGEVTKFQVGPQVKRLDEVKVGDEVTAEYTVTVQAERRAATPEEAANPIAITEVTGRSAEGSVPAGGMARRVRVVTTVAAVDLEKMLITLKGPKGNTITVKARDPERAKQLHVGDTIVVAYLETAAVSLVKAPAKS